MSKPVKPKPIKTIMFYIRSEEAQCRQIVVVKVDNRQYRFTEGKMKSEISDYNLSEQELSDIETRAHRKAMSFFPGVDKYQVVDSTGYYGFPDVEAGSLLPVSSQAMIDSERVQNLLCEFQVAIGRF